MNPITDAEIHQIVQRVLQQTLGQSWPGQGLPGQPKPPDPAPQPPAAPKSEPAAGLKPGDKKVVAIGADHGGFDLKGILKADLTVMGYEIIDVGVNRQEAVDYPDFAHEVARLVGTGKAWRGIMIDGAGIGSCIVANKVPGVRAGMAYDLSSASNSREHNDTNVLTLGAGLIGVNLAKQIVKTWLTTEFGGGRHARRIEKITAVEKLYIREK